MKKILLGTTAIVAATVISAGTAKAEMTISGWNTFGIGAGNVQADTGTSSADGSIDIYENGEIYFNGATTLDSGMTLQWDVQLETENANVNFIDENYFTIADDWGTVIIGQENLPNYKMHYSGGMWVGNAGLSSTHMTQFSGSPGGISYFHYGFMNDTGPIGNDSDMMSYYSPRAGGVQVGVGWQPDSGTSDGQNTGAATFEDTVSIGLNYTMDMDGTSVAVSGGYTNSDMNVAGVNSDVEIEQWQIGTQIGMGPVTVGLSYYTMDDDNNARAGDTTTYMAGINYAAGPSTFGVSYSNSEAKDTTAIAGDTEGQAAMIAHDLALGGGVSLTSALVWLDIEDEGTNVDSDGFVGTVMLNAGF